MSQVFQTVLRLSLSASVLTLSILAVRLLFRRLPRRYLCCLWALVAVRLLVPFSIQSPLSLQPANLIPSRTETIAVPYGAGEALGNATVQAALNRIPATDNVHPQTAPVPAPDSAPQAEAEHGLLSPEEIAPWIWIAGMALLQAFTLFRWVQLRRCLATATLCRDGVKESEYVSSPFVLGVFRPMIYLPYRMEPRDRELVLAHERAHIRRRDHIWKPLAFLLLTVHWFNPVLWMAYILVSRDIESACDETVICQADEEVRKAYCRALLRCSTAKSHLAGYPLSFGEVGVKARVQAVLRYRKPAAWTMVLSAVLCVVLTGCFLTDPAVTPLPSASNEGQPQTGAVPEPDLRPETVFSQPLEEVRINYTPDQATADGCVVYLPGSQPREGEIRNWERWVAFRNRAAAGKEAAVRLYVQYEGDTYFVYDISSDGTQYRCCHWDADSETYIPFYCDETFPYLVCSVGRLSSYGPMQEGYMLSDNPMASWLEYYRDVSLSSVWYPPGSEKYAHSKALPLYRTISPEEQERTGWGTAYADLDCNGVQEMYSLGYGPLSGPFSIAVSVSQEGQPDACKVFVLTAGDQVRFEQPGDGILQIRSFQGLDDSGTVYSLALQDGVPVLLLAGKAVESMDYPSSETANP